MCMKKKVLSLSKLGKHPGGSGGFSEHFISSSKYSCQLLSIKLCQCLYHLDFAFLL